MKKLALLSLAFLTIFTLVSAKPAAADDQAVDPVRLTELETLLGESSAAPSTPAQSDLDKLLSNPSRIETVCFWIPTGDCCGTGGTKMIEENSCTGATRCGFSNC